MSPLLFFLSSLFARSFPLWCTLHATENVWTPSPLPFDAILLSAISAGTRIPPPQIIFPALHVLSPATMFFSVHGKAAFPTPSLNFRPCSEPALIAERQTSPVLPKRFTFGVPCLMPTFLFLSSLLSPFLIRMLKAPPVIHVFLKGPFPLLPLRRLFFLRGSDAVEADIDSPGVNQPNFFFP